jgi:hypothetical protein
VAACRTTVGTGPRTRSLAGAGAVVAPAFAVLPHQTIYTRKFRLSIPYDPTVVVTAIQSATGALAKSSELSQIQKASAAWLAGLSESEALRKHQPHHAAPGAGLHP